MIHYHITQGALDSEEGDGGRVAIWNDSNNIELTMSIKEIIELEERFFIDINANVSDKIMGNLLYHFRDDGQLYDKKDLSRV
jgi:hypothetical protein